MDRYFANRTVSATEFGSGPPLVLLHSLLSDRASFDAVIPTLANTFRVIVAELPGFGASHPVEGGLEAVADRVAEAITDAARGAAPIIVGNGYGGFVALLMAIRHPAIARRLVLADCGAAFSEPGRQAFRNMSAAAQASGLSAVTDVAMRRLFASEFQERHPDLMQDRREAFLRTDITTFRAACDALADLDLRPHLADMKIPTLVLVGEQDEATPPPMSHELASMLPDARLIVLPGCAHVPQLQAPSAFLEAIDGFLRA